MSNESPFGDAHRNDDTGSGEAAALHHSNTSADLPALYLTTSPLLLIETLPNTRDSQTGSSGPEIQVGCRMTSIWEVVSTPGTSEPLAMGITVGAAGVSREEPVGIWEPVEEPSSSASLFPAGSTESQGKRCSNQKVVAVFLSAVAEVPVLHSLSPCSKTRVKKQAATTQLPLATFIGAGKQAVNVP